MTIKFSIEANQLLGLIPLFSGIILGILAFNLLTIAEDDKMYKIITLLSGIFASLSFVLGLMMILGRYL